MPKVGRSYPHPLTDSFEELSHKLEGFSPTGQKTKTARGGQGGGLIGCQKVSFVLNFNLKFSSCSSNQWQLSNSRR